MARAQCPVLAAGRERAPSQDRMGRFSLGLPESHDWPEAWTDDRQEADGASAKTGGVTQESPRPRGYANRQMCASSRAIVLSLSRTRLSACGWRDAPRRAALANYEARVGCCEEMARTSTYQFSQTGG